MISEKKLQKLKAQYFKKLQNIGLAHKWKEAIQLIHSDPTKGEFTNWMLLQLKAGSSIEDILPTVKYFHQNRKLFSEKDINKYENLKQLENLIKEIELKKSSGSTKEIQESERTSIWSNDEYLLVRINSKNASQKYGKGTKWCITMENASYYEQYKAHNIVFYFLLPKTPGKEKFAFSVRRGLDNSIEYTETFDAEDNPIMGNEVPYYDEFSSVMNADAIQQPREILPKLVDGDATKEEFLNFVKIYIDNYQEAVKSKDKIKIKSAINELKALQGYFEQYPNSLLFVSNKYPEILYALSLENASEEIIKKVFNKKIDDKTLSDDIILRISYNDNIPLEILEQLVNSDNENIEIWKKLITNKNITSKIIDKLLEKINKYSLVNDGEAEIVLLQISIHPKTSIETLEKLSKMKFNKINNNIKINICYNPNTPKDLALNLLREFINGDNESIKYDIADNSKTPSEILEELAKSNNVYIKHLVAKNPNTSQEVLIELVKSGNFDITSSVFSNPNISIELFQELLPFANLNLFDNLVRNSYIAPEILTYIYYNTEADVDFLLIRNPKTPTKVLESIISENLGNDPSYIYEGNIARHPNISTNIAKQLMSLNNFGVNSQLAQNPKLPPEILEELSKINDDDIKYFVAVNPNTPSNIRDLLRNKSQNESEEVPKSKTPAIEKYYTQLPNFQVLPSDIDEVLEIAKNPNVSEDVISQLLKLNNTEVNKLLLNNPKVPVNIKQQLRQENYMEKYVDEYVSAVNMINDILKFADCYYNFIRNV